MTRAQELIKEASGLLQAVRLNENTYRKPNFEFGVSTELLRFILKAGKDTHYPLIWMQPPTNEESEFWPFVSASITINLCTRETDTNLLNVERLERSYQHILNPLWEDLQRAMRKTNRIQIDEESVDYEMIPNFPEGNTEKVAGQLWDVLQVSFDALFAPENECKLKHKI